METARKFRNTENMETAQYKIIFKSVLLNDGMNIDSRYGVPETDMIWFTDTQPNLNDHLTDTYKGIRGNNVRKNTMFPINTFTRYYRNKRTGVTYARQMMIVDLLLFPKARNTY